MREQIRVCSGGEILRYQTEYYQAVNQVSFTVDAVGVCGALWGLPAPGKTTLLNLISTIDRVSARAHFLRGYRHYRAEARMRCRISEGKTWDLCFRTLTFWTP